MPTTPRPYLYQDLRYLGGAEAFAESIFRAIRQNGEFARLNLDDCRLLACFMHCFAAPPGAELLTEGTEGDHLLIVFSGRVEVSRLDLTGRPVRLANVGAGAVLGEMSLIDHGRRVASCHALEETHFAVLERSGLAEIIATHPRLANKLLLWLLETCVDRLRDMVIRVMPEDTVFLA